MSRDAGVAAIDWLATLTLNSWQPFTSRGNPVCGRFEPSLRLADARGCGPATLVPTCVRTRVLVRATNGAQTQGKRAAQTAVCAKRKPKRKAAGEAKRKPKRKARSKRKRKPSAGKSGRAPRRARRV